MRMRRSRTVAVAVVGGALLLGGCAQPEPDLSREAAVALQEAVLAVAEAASQGRHDAAAEAAAEVRAALDAAAMTGSLSLQRYRTIDSALRSTEAELAALIEAEAAAAAQAAAEQAAAEQAAEQAAAEQAAQEAAERQAAEERDRGKGDEGKGDEGKGGRGGDD